MIYGDSTTFSYTINCKYSWPYKYNFKFRLKSFSNGYKIFAIFDYLPNDKSDNYFLTEEQLYVKSIVYNYKIGFKLEEIVKLFVSSIRNEFNDESYKGKYLVLIPPINDEFLVYRASNFLELLSSYLEMKNGYELVKRSNVEYDYNQKKISREDFYSFFIFNDSLLNKELYIIDAVLSTGIASKYFFEKLQNMGVKKATFIYLAKSRF